MKYGRQAAMLELQIRISNLQIQKRLYINTYTDGMALCEHLEFGKEFELEMLLYIRDNWT